MRLALVVEYEGTKYHGFQYQANAPSIQEELEKAIARLTGEASRITGAGRTDAGVHAKGQVVAFDTCANHTAETFVRALNFFLPNEIAVKAAHRTGSDFDPRRMALSRRYMYTIHYGSTPSPLIRRTSHRVGEALSVDRMRRATQVFVGTHDFASFAGPLSKSDASTHREVYEAKLRQDGDVLNFEVEANSFLPHQVRRMVGALVDIGRGRLTLAELRLMLDGGSNDVAAHTLPPQGLCLLKVTYADFPPKAGKLDGYPD